MKKTIALAAFAVAAASSFAGTVNMTASVAKAPGDIVSIVSAKGNFKTFIKLAKQAGVLDELRQQLPMTLVAPTDAAFKKVPAKILNSILSRPAVLKEVLEYHIIPADANLAVLRDNIEIPTMIGYAIRLKKRGSLVRLDNAPVVRANVRASNGVVHIVDTVLLPPRYTGRTD